MPVQHINSGIILYLKYHFELKKGERQYLKDCYYHFNSSQQWRRNYNLVIHQFNGFMTSAIMQPINVDFFIYVNGASKGGFCLYNFVDIWIYTFSQVAACYRTWVWSRKETAKEIGNLQNNVLIICVAYNCEGDQLALWFILFTSLWLQHYSNQLLLPVAFTWTSLLRVGGCWYHFVYLWIKEYVQVPDFSQTCV